MYGPDEIPGIVVHDDGDRLEVRFFGPEIDGRLWIKTEEIRLCIPASQ